MVRSPVDVLLTVQDRLLVWQVPAGWVALSSASVGGGLTRPRWVLNAGVDDGFTRTDLDAWAAEVAGSQGLTGPGCALLTAADVAQVQTGRSWGVTTWATVGVTKPTWAVRPADPPLRLAAMSGGSVVRGPEMHDTDARHTGASTFQHEGRPPPGTINTVVVVPVPLTGSALVQAVGTTTEAKAQVLIQAGVPGTGTSSDAVVVLCPEARGCRRSVRDGAEPAGEVGKEPVPFAGVRSPWGQRIARAVHEAVLAGLSGHPWPPADVDLEVVW